MIPQTHDNLSLCRAFISSNFVRPQDQEPRRALAVAISREPYAGGHDMCQELLKLLHGDAKLGADPWALFDRDLVAKILEDHGLPSSLSAYMPEDKPKELRGVINEIVGVHPPLWDLFQHTCDSMLRLAKIGNVILIGRGAHIVTRELPHVLRVRVVAPFEFRLERAAEGMGISFEEAEKFLRREDRAKAAFVRSHFCEELDDPLAYHLTLNTGKLSLAQGARLLYTALKRL